MSYVLKNFSWGELASDVSDIATSITLVSGNNLPTSGSFVIVVWDMETYPNPADDPKTEIMIAEYSGSGQVFNVIRAQESTLSIAHSAGDQVALHLTAGLLTNERYILGSKIVDDSGVDDGRFLKYNGISENLEYVDLTTTDLPAHASTHEVGGLDLVDHDSLTGFVSNEHVDHTGVSISAGTGLSGGGDISSSRSLSLDSTLKSNYDAAYSHSQLVSGNPHQVTPTELSLVIGTDVQAWYALLDSIAVMPAGDGHFIVGNGGTFVAESGATARTSLGLGTGDSPKFTGLTIDGNPGQILTIQSTGETDNTVMDFQCERYLLCNYTVARTSGASTQFAVRRSRGTLASPVAVADNDEVGLFVFKAHDGTDYRNVAAISAVVKGTVATNNVPGSLFFYTNPGAASYTSVGRFDCAGYFYADNKIGAGVVPQESIHGSAKVRADTAFNLNGTDIITDGSGIADIDGLPKNDGNFIVGDGTNWVAESGGTVRTSLGLGTGDSPSFSELSVGVTTHDNLVDFHANIDNSGAWGDDGSANLGLSNYRTDDDSATILRFTNYRTGGIYPTGGISHGGIAYEYLDNGGDRIRRMTISENLGTADTIVLRDGKVGINETDPQEDVHANDTVRADTAFNLNGTDGLSQTTEVPGSITASGGIITAMSANPYGTMYADNITETVTVSVANTAYEVTGGFTTGEVEGITFPDDHYLQVPSAGKYSAEWSLSGDAGTAANQWEGGLMINGTAQDNGSDHTTQGATSSSSSIGASTILSLSADDQVSLFVRQHTSTDDIEMQHGNLTLVKVGS